MAVKISGVLKDGAGKPVQNCTIQLKAKRNSTTVVVNTVASENPDEAGRYSMDVEYGQYSVILLVEGFPPSHAGTITVYEDSRPGTLNDFLGAMTEDDARPEALRRFELMVEEVARNASAVAQNTAAAKKSASDAGTSARDASASKVAAKSSETSAASSAGSAASSATAAGNSAKAAKTSETNADNSAQAAADSQTASANSATAAKKSETNAKNSEAAAKVSETNAKASENKAKEYLDKVGGLVSPMTQYDWPVVTGNESFYIKIAKLSDPGSNNCHVTLMVTNAGNYGSPYGNIDFIEISARGLPSSLTADNVSRYLSIRRLGATGLTDDNQMRYGLVKGDGFIEVWAFQRAFINGAKVAVLAQTARTELYIPDGFVKQTAAPSGYVEGNVVRIYDQVNKPSKSDVGLSNVTNDAQVKKTGDIMSGDLSITKATPSLYLRSKSGTAHVWFQNEDQSERGVIFAPTNTDTLGEVHIRAKNAKGQSSGDFIVRHDGMVEALNLKVTRKINGATAEFANTSTNSDDTTVNIKGSQHTPLVLTRNNTIKNLSIGFKVDDVDQKYLGIAGDGDLYFGSYSDHTKNSKVITQAKLDSGLTVGGKTTFSDLATFNAGISGAIEPENISSETVDLNNLTIKDTDKGSVKYYQCRTAGGGANITNKPDGVGGNFLLRVESIRKVSDSDYINMQTLISGDKGRVYVRFVTNGNFTAWSEHVVSGWNQDVTVRSLTSTTPSKLGGGRIDVLGSTSDYGEMNCTVRGVDSTGTNSAWSVGTSESTGKMLYLKNHRSSAQVLLNGDDGAVQLLSGTVNGATAQALTINKDEVNSTVDLTLTKQSGTGNRFVLQNAGNAELPFFVSVWGSSTRQNVLEVATSAAYLFYAQRTPAGQLFDVNGAINCTTLNQSSDRDLKDDIRVISDATKAIRKMNGYTYTLKENGLPYAGVIAQEVMEAIPEAVGSFTHYGEELQGPTVDGNKLREETRYLNVDYAAVTGLLVQVARETDDRVTALEEENTTLRQNLATAGTRISTLENQVSELVALVRQLTGSEH
ncbi:prophage tail fiber N-terminal domain-containing protein [Escherichia coli]|uniref:prophage tail fiber N-terminal domain-containing protein n=1 Tax=Escherichia coli TaxID=562 RepID=UPI001E65A6C9|nr:prophage tail fiber N-terminal domain-containing protein [Escherichia coli]MCD7026692.1 prophage tail fiber N-terminal domain-containing protein [Escherichia coli]